MPHPKKFNDIQPVICMINDYALATQTFFITLVSYRITVRRYKPQT